MIVLLTSLAGCVHYSFEVTSPDVPMGTGDFVTYRMLGEANQAGGTINVTCADEVCTSGGLGGDEAERGSEILVWLDVAGDDFEDWRAEGSRDMAVLAPDDEDPRGETTWDGGVWRRFELELLLP